MPTNFSFSGCGFLGIYHLGVATCLNEHIPDRMEDCRIAGASAGAVVACCLLTGCSLGKCTSYVLELANEANAQPLLGPFHPRFSLVSHLRKSMTEVLPADAYKRASGRLFISLTRWRDWENIIVSEYANNEELIDAMICSAFVPLYCGLIPPKYKGTYYWDGGLSNNQPTFSEETITISPFSGEVDICPMDDSANFIHLNMCNSSVRLTAENLSRLSIALFPPNAQKLSDICKQGYDDALRYLQKNALISCTHHLRITTAIDPLQRDGRVMSVSEKDWDSIEKHIHKEDCNDCKECKSKVREALSTSLPPQVLEVLQSAMVYNKKSPMNYLRQGKIYKAAYMLIKPCFIPADILYSFLIRCIQCIPQVHQDLDSIMKDLRCFLGNTHKKLFHKHHKYNTKFEYHCALTEDDYKWNQHDVDTQNDMDLNMKMDCQGFAADDNIETSTQLSGMNGDTATMYTTKTPKNPALVLNAMRDNQQIQDSASKAVLDQFKHWLDSTNYMEAAIAYYYLDVDTNTVMVEQIYNLPEAASTDNSEIDQNKTHTDQKTSDSEQSNKDNVTENLKKESPQLKTSTFLLSDSGNLKTNTRQATDKEDQAPGFSLPNKVLAIESHDSTVDPHFLDPNSPEDLRLQLTISTDTVDIMEVESADSDDDLVSREFDHNTNNMVNIQNNDLNNNNVNSCLYLQCCDHQSQEILSNRDTLTKNLVINSPNFSNFLHQTGTSTLDHQNTPSISGELDNNVNLTITDNYETISTSLAPMCETCSPSLAMNTIYQQSFLNY